MLIMRNIDDMSQQQIGNIENCSRSRVSRLITTAKEQLKQDFNQDLTNKTNQGETKHDGDNNQ
jgi:DNA-directed RNA polymerase specialized sigma subunit